MKAKFKIGDKVIAPNYSKTFKGSILNCWLNEEDNLRIVDGEISYVVYHDNYRGRMVMTYDIKESELILDEKRMK
jgi:hypothetical protein